jgi:hypothetical protein
MTRTGGTDMSFVRCTTVAALLVAVSTAPAQIRTWDGFNGGWDDPFNWDPNDVPDTTAETALLGGTSPYTVFFDIAGTNTLGRLIFTNPNATIGIRPNSRLVIDQSSNSFFDTANDGTIELTSGNFFQRGRIEIIARPDNTSTIVSNAGTGVFDLDQSNDGNVIAPMFRTDGFRVRHSNGHRIVGNGRIDIDSTEFVNNGSIAANDDGEALRLFTATGSTLFNNNELLASGSAILEINAEVDQTGGGFIITEDDALLRLAGSIRGGDIATADDSSAETLGRLTLDTVETDADLLLTHELTLTGNALVNNGTILRETGGSDPADSEIVAEWPHVITGNGTLEMAPSTTLRTLNNDPRPITNGMDHTIFGGGFIRSAMTNEGTIRVGTPTVGRAMVLSDNPKTNDGLIEVTAGSDLLVDSIDITQGNNGVIDAGLGALLFIGFGPSSVTGGAILSDPATGLVEITSSFGTPVIVTMNGVNLDARTRVFGRLRTNAGFKNSGTIDLLSGSADPPGELLIDGRAVIDGIGAVRVFTLGRGLIRTVSGGSARFGPDQAIAGSPTLDGTFRIDGTLILPLPTDAAEVEGDLTFTSTASLEVGLDAVAGTVARITRPAGGATIKLEGTLRITLADPAEPVPDTPFTIIEPTGAISGTFDTVEVTNAPVGFPGFDVIYESDRVSIQLAATSCNAADLAEPFGQLTFADIGAFLSAFNAQDPAADLAVPFGQFTFADISAFLAAFTAGCP